jgi:hypothetical protein
MFFFKRKVCWGDLISQFKRIKQMQERIYVELKKVNTPKKIDGSKKIGNTYQIFIGEDFNQADRRDLEELLKEINFQIAKDGMEPVDFRSMEPELRRVGVDRRIDIRLIR